MNLVDCYYLGYFSRASSKGDRVTLKLDTDKPENYKNLESVLVLMHASDQTPVPFFVKKVHSLKEQELLLELDLGQQIPDHSFLKSKSAYLPLSTLPKLDEKSFYFHEVIGYKVLDQVKGDIGLVTDTYESAAHVVLGVTLGDKEILIPMTDEVFKKIDRSLRTIEVNAPEGLIDLYLS